MALRLIKKFGGHTIPIPDTNGLKKKLKGKDKIKKEKHKINT